MRFALLVGLLLISEFALACKMDPAEADKADRGALKQAVQKDKDLKGYQIKEITKRTDFYEVRVRQARTTKTLRFKVERAADCTLDIQKLK